MTDTRYLTTELSLPLIYTCISETLVPSGCHGNTHLFLEAVTLLLILLQLLLPLGDVLCALLQRRRQPCVIVL